MPFRLFGVLGAVVVISAAALLVGFGVVAAEGTGKGPFVNPDAGFTDAQREARISAARAEFEAKYADWKAHLDISKLDLRALPHASIMASYIGPEPDLVSALAAADVVVVGKATGIQPATQGSILTFAVSRVLKGEPGDSLTVLQDGGFEPGPDWKGVMISDADQAPTLLPGDEAMLFLKRSDQLAGGHYIQAGSGFYRVVDGRVVALGAADNPFGRGSTG